MIYLTTYTMNNWLQHRPHELAIGQLDPFTWFKKVSFLLTSIQNLLHPTQKSNFKFKLSVLWGGKYSCIGHFLRSLLTVGFLSDHWRDCSYKGKLWTVRRDQWCDCWNKGKLWTVRCDQWRDGSNKVKLWTVRRDKWRDGSNKGVTNNVIVYIKVSY